MRDFVMRALMLFFTCSGAMSGLYLTLFGLMVHLTREVPSMTFYAIKATG